MASSEEETGTLSPTGILCSVLELTEIGSNAIENAEEIAVDLLGTPSSCLSQLVRAVREAGVRLRPTYRLGDGEMEVLQRLDVEVKRDRPACELPTCQACALSALVEVLAALVALAAEAASIVQQTGMAE